MSAYPLPTKAKRKQELMCELRRWDGLKGIPVEFIDKWLGAAVKCVTQRYDRTATVLLLYYGLSSDFRAHRLAPLAGMFGVSTVRISQIRAEGVGLLRCEFRRLYKSHGAEAKVVPIIQAQPATTTESLLLTEFLHDHYVRSKIEERCPKIAANSARGALLRNGNYRRKVLKWLPLLLEKHLGRPATVSDLLTLKPDDIRAIGKRRLGAPAVEWVEEYLHLFNFVLPNTLTTYGMTAARQELLKAV